MRNVLNRNQLKIIAIISMILDHIGMFFIPATSPNYYIFRFIGRLTAPIMCFFIAEGYFYTKSKMNYGIRLFIFAVISQFAYSFSHHLKLFAWDFSVIFTLFISFLILLSYNKIINKTLRWITIVLLMIITVMGDWGVIGPLWVLVFWIYRDRTRQKFIAYGIISVIMVFLDGVLMATNGQHWHSEIWQVGLFLSIPLLQMYNGEKGKDNFFSKWTFYIFYPLHLFVLGLIKYILAYC